MCGTMCVFFNKLSEELKDLVTNADKSVVVGGILMSFSIKTLMVEAGKKRSDSVQYVEDMTIERDLVDIWRIRNPTDTRFTWGQKSF